MRCCPPSSHVSCGSYCTTYEASTRRGGVGDRGRLGDLYYCLPRALERVPRADGAWEGVLVADAATRADTRRPPGVSGSLTSLPSGMPSGMNGSAAARFLPVAGVVNPAAAAALADAGDAGGGFADTDKRFADDFLGVAAAIAAATKGATDERRRLARRGAAPNASLSLSVASLQPPASLAGDSGWPNGQRAIARERK